MRALFSRFCGDETGATAIEYCLIATGIAFAIIASGSGHRPPAQHQIRFDQQFAEVSAKPVVAA